MTGFSGICGVSLIFPQHPFLSQGGPASGDVVSTIPTSVDGDLFAFLARVPFCIFFFLAEFLLYGLLQGSHRCFGVPSYSIYHPRCRCCLIDLLVVALRL